MDDWRHRILEGLRESNLLLLVLSPAYLASPYCEWEIVEFLKYENSRAVQGQGVAPIYFVEVPGLDAPGFEQQAAAWLALVRRSNQVDLRPWYHEGADALKRKDVRDRLDELKRSLADRLRRLRRAANAPGNLPAINQHFVGREVEMERLHRSAGLGQFGLLTAVQGVGGMGKTALAIQYAHAYPDFYPGGRWMIGCAGKPSLASAIRSLDSDLGIQFTDEERLDEIRAARRVLSVLQQRAELGAAARAGEEEPPAPRALLLLDNVEAPALLQPPQTDLISGRTWLHVIATTRLDPRAIGTDTTRYCHLPVDELPEEDALRLIEDFQPRKRFPDDAERAAAREIVRLLRGFTLAVEVVAVHLGEHAGRKSCAALLARLRRDGVDAIGKETATGVNHAEKLISLTLAPTLEKLSAAETRALTAAALFPPDSVPLPWLRSVVADAHPEMGQDSDAGHDDHWLTLVNRLIGLRLLQVIEWTPDGRTPRLCRMHRLVQAVARERAGDGLPALQSSVTKVAVDRAKFLKTGWLDWGVRWEIGPLTAFAEHALEAGGEQATYLANSAALRLEDLARYAEAEPLMRRALAIDEKSYGTEHPKVATHVNNLAQLLQDTNRLSEAEPLMRRALAIDEKSYGPEHPEVATDLNNLAALLQATNRLPEAEPLMRRRLEVLLSFTRATGHPHPHLQAAVNNYAGLLSAMGRSREEILAQLRQLAPEFFGTLQS